MLRVDFVLDDFSTEAFTESSGSICRFAYFAIQSLFVEPPGSGENLFVSVITKAVKNTGKTNAILGKQQAVMENSGHH
jgi:hypothetical protein